MTDSFQMAELLEEIYQRLEMGEPVDVSLYAARYPHLASQLQQLVPAMAMLDELSQTTLGSRNEKRPASLPISSLGGFRLLRELGRGGMGVVYEAEQLSLSRRVAVKILPFAAIWPENALLRFHQEVHTVALLDHPHIVPVFSIGCEQGVHFYAMKLINGCSLADIMKSQEAGEPSPIASLPRSTSGLPWYRAIARLGKEAAQALAFAHKQRVIHRDIKPSNLLLDRDGNLFIADFGLARSENDANLTHTGELLGTPRYMSPEQAAGDSKQLDARTDIFSLGATLYELLAFRPVITARGRVAAIRALKQLQVIPLRTHDRNIPRPLEYIVLKCLQPMPDDRYNSAAELAADLQRFLEGRTIAAGRPGITHRTSRWVNRNPRVAVSVFASVVMCLVLVAIGSWIAQQRRYASPTPRGPPPGDLVTTSPDTSSVLNLNSDQESLDMLRTSRSKRKDTNANNLHTRRLTLEQLEQRTVMSADFIDAFVPSGSGGLDSPGGMEFGPDGDLFVGSRGTSDAILRYDGTTGAIEGAFVTSGSGGLDGPFDLTFGPDGNLYVSSWEGTHAVLRYDGQTGANIDTFVPAGSGGLTRPTGLLFAPDGNLLVSSYDSGEVLKYRGPTNVSIGHPAGEFLGVFATTGVGSTPDFMAFGPDGNLYVGCPGHFTSLPLDATVYRYDGNSGVLIDTFIAPGEGGLKDVRAILFDKDGNLLLADVRENAILRYQGPNGISPGDYIDSVVPPSLGGLTHPIDIAFGTDGNLYVGSIDTDAILRYGHIKFYVVNDGSINQNYEYTAAGLSGESYAISTTNAAPRGAASTSSGTTVWVVDANKKVYVYNTNGGTVGSWTAGSLASKATLEGIATNGTDVWLVDSKSDKVFKYTGAAGRTSGSQNAASSFSLNSSNSNPKDIVTDGVHLWVVNDGTFTDKVFKYTVAGTLVGSWTISTSGAGRPTGITIDPSNVSDIWIVDSSADKVFQYTAAASLTSGGQSAAASFVLASGNSNPQGIADPPPPVALASDKPDATSPNTVDVAFGQLMEDFLNRQSSDTGQIDRTGRRPVRTPSAAARILVEFVPEQIQVTSATRNSTLPQRQTSSLEDLFSSWDSNDTQLLDDQ